MPTTWNSSQGNFTHTHHPTFSFKKEKKSIDKHMYYRKNMNIITLSSVLIFTQLLQKDLLFTSISILNSKLGK